MYPHNHTYEQDMHPCIVLRKVGETPIRRQVESGKDWEPEECLTYLSCGGFGESGRDEGVRVAWRRVRLTSEGPAAMFAQRVVMSTTVAHSHTPLTSSTRHEMRPNSTPEFSGFTGYPTSSPSRCLPRCTLQKKARKGRRSSEVLRGSTRSSHPFDFTPFLTNERVVGGWTHTTQVTWPPTAGGSKDHRRLWTKPWGRMLCDLRSSKGNSFPQSERPMELCKQTFTKSFTYTFWTAINIIVIIVVIITITPLCFAEDRRQTLKWRELKRTGAVHDSPSQWRHQVQTQRWWKLRVSGMQVLFPDNCLVGVCRTEHVYSYCLRFNMLLVPSDKQTFSSINVYIRLVRSVYLWIVLQCRNLRERQNKRWGWEARDSLTSDLYLPLYLNRLQLSMRVLCRLVSTCAVLTPRWSERKQGFIHCVYRGHEEMDEQDLCCGIHCRNSPS